ncbi:MAG: hypothetical protein ABFD91_07580 [Anaerohalosphaeraceae bacterium]
MIKYQCPKCNQKLGVPDNYAGRRVRCSKCNEPSVVPKPVTEIDITAAQPVAAAPDLSPEQIAASIFQTPTGAKPAPVQIEFQKPTAPKSQPLDELQLIPEDDAQSQDDLRKAKILREASRQRAASSMAATPRAAKEASSRRAVSGGELAKGIGKIPLSIATCFAAMIAVIAVWVVVGVITGFEFWYIVLCVPLAGAWGLVAFTENRGVLLGLLAVVLGLVGMVAGRAAIAKWVIMPMYHEDETYNSEVDDFYRETVGFPDTLPTERAELEGLSRNERVMLRIAAWDLVQSSRMDTDIYDQLFLADIEDTENELEENVQNALYDAADHMDVMSTAQRVELLKTHFDSIRENYQQNIQPKLDSFVQSTTFLWAFKDTFRFLDLILFPMGLFGAYKYAAGTED